MTEIKPETPLPWRNAGGDAILAKRDEALVVVGSAEREADNLYIVHTANTHPSLIAGLREARIALAGITPTQHIGESEQHRAFYSVARATLAKLDALLSQEGQP